MSNNNEIVAVLRQALEALERAAELLTRVGLCFKGIDKTITSIRQAIAEAEKQRTKCVTSVSEVEPVAWQYTTNFYNPNKDNGKRLSYSLGFAQVHAIPDTIEPLYTNPQPKFGVCL
jgi:dihydroorotate dehydrogenase